MSTRGRRARGRPPKTPLSTNRTNFLRKPKAYQNQDLSNVNNAGSASPVSHYKSTRGDRGRGRASAHRGRHFLSQLIAEDDELSSLPEFENDRTSDFTDLDNTDVCDGSDVSFDGQSDDDHSSDDAESLSTVSSSVSKRRFLLKRPKTPELLDDKEIPPLGLPSSATDLLLPTEDVLQAVGIYEVLRHFRITLRLSPFTFEDFCAAILSEEQGNLLAEMHITLLKALFREEENSNTTFGPQDLKDSVNISLFFLDSMTWPEIARAYLDSEKHPEYRAPLSVLESPDFPFVPFSDKLKVLQTLTDLFLATTKVREEILNEGNITYDDHCRSCHKLGDLLCCETCSAVYHLACVEPPMEEVPEDDWLCSVCRAHQVKGVTDCVSEAEKSGLLCRQEPIGYDRHTRKYWFLCRRIIVESEKETWYYSTKYQLEELLEALDPVWESDLISFINDMKEDIIKQMTYTEELTASAKGSRKSVLDIENAQLMKVQTERSLKKAKEEEERKAKKEEEERLKEEERKKKEEEDKESPLDESFEKEGKEKKTEDKTTEEIVESVAKSTAVVTSQVEEKTSTITENTSENSTTTECLETTTTTTTITTIKSITTTSTTTSESSTGTEADSQDEPPAKKFKARDSVAGIGNDGDKSSSSKNTEKGTGTGSVPESGDQEEKVVSSSKATLVEAMKPNSDGKPKVINLQSLLPGSGKSILDALDKNADEKSDGKTKTVLLVNRDGGKVTLQVTRQPVSKEAEENNKSSVTQTSSTTSTTSVLESRKMLTRSKTGSLTPKLFTDSITMTSSSLRASGKSSDEVLVINKDGETTRMSRSKMSLATSIVQQSLYFKLGAEGSYKQYQNQYTSNTLALNKHQHNEERDKRRHLSHKFSLTQTSEFKWNGTLVGNRLCTLATLRLTITSLESNIQAPFMHSNWPNHRQNWQKAVQMSQTPRDFALAIAILEACLKPCVFNPVWHESLGHVRLNRITMADREEWKKKEKENRRRREDEEDARPVVWIKYTLGLKHQVWKHKGEEYRVTGGNGWQWISITRVRKEVAQDSIGLRAVAARLRNRRLKVAKAEKKELLGKKEGETSQEGNEEKGDEGNEEKGGEGNEEKGDDEMEGVEEEKPQVKEEVSNEEDDERKGDKEKTGDAVPKASKDEASLKSESKTRNKDDVEIKEEKAETDNMVGVSKPVRPKLTPGQRVESDFREFVSQMKAKYVEDEDAHIVLDLLKKHPEKVADIELINVSESLQKRSHYPKLSKPYSRLDGLLERRLKQDEFERKQRLTIETQIGLKMKLSQAIETAKKKKEERESNQLKQENEKLVNGDLETKLEASPLSPKPYSCYSASCRDKKDSGAGFTCYSPFCRWQKKNPVKKKEPPVVESSSSNVSTAGGSTSNISESSSKESSPEDEDRENVESLGNGEKSKDDSSLSNADSEEKSSKENDSKDSNNEQSSDAKSSSINEEEDVDIEGDTSMSSPTKGLSTDGQNSQTGMGGAEGDKENTRSQDGNKEKSVLSPDGKSAESTPVSDSTDRKSSKSTPVSDIVKNLVIKTMAEKAVASSSAKGVVMTPAQALSTAVANISVEELQAKLPPKRTTAEKFKLAKFARINAKKVATPKTGGLPKCHKFESRSKKKSILVLDRGELRKLARFGGKRESAMFNYNCKMNNVCWLYPCPRPLFKTSWLYRTMTLRSLSAAAIQLRILWSCIRWDDMAAKPPAGGTNTISTETEITTTELLKRREVGPDGLRSEFLVRKIVVPLGVPDKPKEKYTPQRSGLRERKRLEAARQTEPSVTEVWIPEEVLELWEIKQFGEKLEKQRQAIAEKAEKTTATTQSSTVASSQTAAQIKAQMEQQLKQQRLALAQKRIQDNQGIKITTGTSPASASSSATTIIINNTNISSLGKQGTTFKTLTVSSPSSLLSSGIIKTMQPKTIITNAGSLLGPQLRPGIRVQIPGSALQLRPQTVTLAPKPGTTAASSPGVNTITRLISPASSVARIVSPATPQGTKGSSIQIKPQASTGQPVQNLQFIQGPGGQIQVRGLLPGQIIQKMPDGKLQILTINTSATATSTAQSVSTPQSQASQPQPATPRPTLSIRPQQTIMVSLPGVSAGTPTVATQNRLVIPAQLANQSSSSGTLTLPTVRQVVGSTPGKQVIITRPAGAQVVSAQSAASALGQANPLPATIVSAPSLNSAVVISAPTPINPSATPTIIGSSVSGVTTVLVNSSQSPALLSSLTSTGPGQQTLISTLKSTGVPSQTISIPTTTTVSTSLATGQSATSLLAGQVISGTSLLQRPAGGSTSLLNISPGTLQAPNSATLTLAASSTATQIPKLLGSPPSGTQIITRPLGATQAQLIIRPGSSMLAGGQAKVITAQQLRGLTPSPIQLKAGPASMSPIKTILSPTSSILLPAGSSKSITAVRSLTPQLAVQTTSAAQQQQGQTTLVASTSAATVTVSASPDAATSLGSPTPGLSPSAGAGAPKYAITPQVVEQVVRQALLQNQTPEIQQKLLAMQRQIQQQQRTTPTASAAVAISGSTPSIQRVAQSSAITSTKLISPSPSSTVADQHKAKGKGLTQEQKEEQSRSSVCYQVMKNILDKIEREEKQEQRNKKKLESAEEKHKRMAAINQQKALFKHKEGLKKEILRKRSLMEKNLQQEIFNEMAEKLKKVKASTSVKSPQSGSAASGVTVTSTAPTPVTLCTNVKAAKKQGEMPKSQQNAADTKSTSRKRKQKLISTGVKGLNPKEKLYCVCKTPYDDSKFYIGCDLCSNWFHGACVNISEDQARFIDSYVCEDCRKQQENTSEELYCLCRTPYDENHFYIGCDRCQDWFHGYCVGISKNEADSIDVYVCPNCQKEEVADPIAQRPLNQTEYSHIEKLLRDMQAHKMAWPFLNPVDPREVPDYYDVIAEPMDLTIVEAKLKTKAYDKLNDFVKDVTKIFDNCRFYNPVGTPYYQCAEVIETFFAQRIKALRSAHKL